MNAEGKFWEALRRLSEEIDRLRESQKKTDEQLRKTDEELRKAWEQAEKEMRELRERQEKTDEQLRKTDEQLRKTDEQLRKTDEGMKELQRLIKDLSNNVGGLNRSFGKIPEALSEPQVEEKFEEAGFRVLGAYPNIWGKYNDKKKEIDLLIKAKRKGKSYIIVVETQVQFRAKKEIDDFIGFLKKDFRKYFDEYAGMKVIGCVCALKFSRGVDEYAIEKGLYCMKPVKGIMGLINPKNFKPEEF